MNKIPSVNLADFLSNDISKKQQFIDDIGHAYENIGFIALKGHFLDDALVDELYEQIKDFFELPVDVKRKYEVPGIGGQRGYVSFGKESAKGKKEGDLKEFWHFGQYVENNSALELEYPKNVFVNELPKFNQVGKTTYRMLEKTAKYVLRSLAIHLGLDEKYFDQYIHNGNSILRPIHYPPIKSEPKNAVNNWLSLDNEVTVLIEGFGSTTDHVCFKREHLRWQNIDVSLVNARVLQSQWRLYRVFSANPNIVTCEELRGQSAL